MLARLLKLLSTMTGQDSITSRKCSNNRPSSATASTSSARPALQEIPKNLTKSNAKKRRMQSSCRIPTAPRALMQPSSHPLPVSLPASDASDGEEARMGKKRKWEDEGSEQYDFGRSINEVLRGMQAADRMAKMERRRDQQIRDFQYAVEELRQRNEELQAKIRESEAEMDAYRVDLLKEREETTALVQTRKKTHIRLLNEWRAYMIRYNKLLAENAENEVTESRQLETQRALEAKLQKSQDQLKQLESTSRAAETNLTLKNEKLQTLVSELELKNASAQARIDEQAQARAAIDVERETERQAFSTRETKLMRRIDELIRTTKSMRANIAKECNTEDREAAQMSLKEDYELRLRKVKESADERVKKLQEEYRESLSCRTDYTRTNAEPARKGSDTQVEASQQEQDPQLSAAPRGPAKWKHKQHTTSDKNADRLQLHTKETEITSLQRVNKNLSLQVSAASKQIAAYSDLALRKDLHIEQQIHTLADRDLAIRHLRSRNIAMKWHISAIKSQRAAALTSQSTTQSECETQFQEIERLRTLLETSELAQIQAETAQTAQDTAIRHLRSRNIAMKWYLAAIKFRRAAVAAEIELPLAVGDETHTIRSTSTTTPPPSAALLSSSSSTSSSTQTAPPKSPPPTTPNNELAAATAAAAPKKNSSTCQNHEKCAVEKKWLDERYHETWISNRGLVEMVEKLRAEMAGMRPTCGCWK